ncbi:hypothetical protein IV203_037041 [Nitzschia inconspicua]|uniref:Uncharacterized protein n=1 Tax=Nitzschia inconspicua TaxID=303405 RepID=A0A9K3LL72_9STRA|nr:hypothetical protein IV203_037041 [Nitzschia inconspicua]
MSTTAVFAFQQQYPLPLHSTVTKQKKGYYHDVHETKTFSFSSLAMLENPEDYYQAFGESSSKSYSFPTEGNLDPPPPPLKRFTKGERREGETDGKQEKKTETTRSTSSSTTPTNSTTTPTTKTFQRYAPPEENTPKAKIPTTATSPSSTYTPPSPPLKRYNLESATFTSTSSSPRPTSTTRVRFQTDSAGIMMEAPCVRLQPNHFVPLPIPPRNKVVRFQQETSGGPMLDATPSTSVPKPKPVLPLTAANINVSSTPTTTTIGPLTVPSATSSTTADSSPSSTFVEGDAAGNLKFQQSRDVPQPQISPPLEQHYRPLQFPTDSAGMMMMQPNVVPKPKPIPPLTVDQIKGTDGTTSSSSTTTPSSSPSSSSQHKQQQQQHKHKLEDKATPPNDDQYYKAQTKQVTDSGITGQPRQPTLLWEQRRSDYLG